MGSGRSFSGGHEATSYCFCSIKKMDGKLLPSLTGRTALMKTGLNKMAKVSVWGFYNFGTDRSPLLVREKMVSKWKTTIVQELPLTCSSLTIIKTRGVTINQSIYPTKSISLGQVVNQMESINTIKKWFQIEISQ